MQRSLLLDRTSCELIDIVRALVPGEEIVLTDNSEPVACIVSDAIVPRLSLDGEKQSAPWRGKLEILDDGNDEVIEHFKNFLP